MKGVQEKEQNVDVSIAKLTEFKGSDLADLCDSTESTILDNFSSFSIGINRKDPPVRESLEAYWKGVLLVPERQLIIGRIDGVVAASIQLVKPGPSNQTSSFSGQVDSHFVAPWARGHGLAKKLLKAAENEAKMSGLSVLKLSVRSNMHAAIRLYESCNYKKWGVLDKYEMIDGVMYRGFFYYKDLD